GGARAGQGVQCRRSAAGGPGRGRHALPRQNAGRAVMNATGAAVSAPSAEDCSDRPAVDDAVGPAVAVVDLSVRRQPQGVVNRGEEVLRRYRVVLDVGGAGVAGAVDLSAADAAAGEQGGLTRAPVGAAAV